MCYFMAPNWTVEINFYSEIVQKTITVSILVTDKADKMTESIGSRSNVVSINFIYNLLEQAAIQKLFSHLNLLNYTILDLWRLRVDEICIRSICIHKEKYFSDNRLILIWLGILKPSHWTYRIILRKTF